MVRGYGIAPRLLDNKFGPVDGRSTRKDATEFIRYLLSDDCPLVSKLMLCLFFLFFLLRQETPNLL